MLFVFIVYRVLVTCRVLMDISTRVQHCITTQLCSINLQNHSAWPPWYNYSKICYYNAVVVVVTVLHRTSRTYTTNNNCMHIYICIIIIISVTNGYKIRPFDTCARMPAAVWSQSSCRYTDRLWEYVFFFKCLTGAMD